MGSSDPELPFDRACAAPDACRLPALELLASRERMTALLASAAGDGGAGVEVDAVDVWYVRFKAGTSITIGVDADVRAGELVVRQRYAVKGFADLETAGTRHGKWSRKALTPVEIGAPAWLDAAASAVVTAFPNDVGLPGLRVISNPDLLRTRIDEHVLPAGERARRHKIALETVKWKPERRFVGRLAYKSRVEATKERVKRSMYVRVHADDSGRRGVAAARAVADVLPFVPRPLGGDADAEVWFHEERAGAPLSDELEAGRPATDVVAEAARALLALHRSGVSLPADRSAARLLEAARVAAAEIVPVRPAVARPLDDLLARLAGSVPAAAARVPVHGDFHARQVLFGPSGVVLLDFDDAGLGDPGFDVGLFLANMDAMRIERAVTSDVHASVTEAFANGYGACPDSTAWYRALGLVALAARPIRNLRPRFDDTVPALLDAARDALDHDQRT